MSQSLKATLEVLCRHHFVKQGFWQGLARVDMSGHVLDHRPLPAEVFHELAGQLDRVPFDAVDAGYAEVVDTGQQVMQAVTEFMEQRDHLVMREQRRFAADGG